MKRAFVAAAGFVLLAASGLAGAAPWQVVVQPGVYGRVAVGGYAEPPQVVQAEPIVAVDNGYGQVVEESIDQAYATDQPPVYLWVPEYQRLHWAQYCREYGAYGVPVYFVDDGWYRANVLRRNWTPEQRSWSQQQWLEQDRLARDRFERQRFERQRYEQQQRWNNERVWHDPQQAAIAAQHAQAVGGQALQPGGGGGRPAGYPPGNGAGPGQQAAQGGAASQPRGAGVAAAENGGERRGEGRRRERGERRGEGEGRAAFEHGHGGNRDR